MLTKEQKQVVLNIISNTKFTPYEWEQVIKPIVMELQKEENKDGSTKDNRKPTDGTN